MANEETIEYINTYKEIAKEQMKKYGIPASITLSQAILESSSGKSQLSKNDNNHFGIKATSSWIKQGGKYSIYQDDRKDDKFKSYDNVKDSFEDHSLLLLNPRYKNCFSLNLEDYSSWAKEIKKAGYATDKDYDKKLTNLIETYNLKRFDLEAIAEAKNKQKEIGYLRDKTKMEKASFFKENKNYSFPLEKQTTLFVTSQWGTRKDPLNSGKTQNHQGVDFRANFEPIMATEDAGRVSSINNDGSSSGGKSISIDYKREDGSSLRVTYMHLSKINVKLGDIVQAGQKIGVSGNSGKRTTGAHLHFQVSKITDSYKRNYDPIAYLEEIAKKGNIKTSIEYNGKNLLSSYRINEEEKPLNPQEWMKKLLSSQDSNLNLIDAENPLMDIIVSIFSSLMALTLKEDKLLKEKEKYERVNLAVESKKQDLSSLTPTLDKVTLEIKDKKSAILKVNSENKEYSLILNPFELKSLYNTLKNEQLSKEEKANYIMEIVKSKKNHDLINDLAKQNFESLLHDKTLKTSLSIK